MFLIFLIHKLDEILFFVECWSKYPYFLCMLRPNIGLVNIDLTMLFVFSWFDIWNILYQLKFHLIVLACNDEKKK